MKIRLKPKKVLYKIREELSYPYIHPDKIPDNEYTIVRGISILDWVNGITINPSSDISIPLYYYDIIEMDFLGDVSEEGLSLRWALYRQFCAGNIPNISTLDTADEAFPMTANGGFYYEDFPEDDWIEKLCDTRICKKYRWIWMPVDLVEWLLQECEKHDVDPSLLIKYPDTPSKWFDLFELPESIKRFELIYPKFLNDHTDESKLQREEISLRRRESTGTVVCFGGCRPSITVGHLSYTKILEGS